MKYFYSLDGLSSKLIDTINVYILPFISLYALICSSIMLIVFCSKKLKGDIYNYMLIESLASVIYSIMNSFIFIIRCGQFCSNGYDYISKFYELYLYIFVGKSIEMFILLIDLYLSIKKYNSFNINQKLSNMNWKKYNFMLIITGSIVISLLFNIMAIFFGRTILQIGNLVYNQTLNNETIILFERSLFVVTKSTLSSNDYFNITSQILSGLHGPVLLFIIMLINVMITYKLKKFLAKKSSISSGMNIWFFLIFIC